MASVPVGKSGGPGKEQIGKHDAVILELGRTSGFGILSRNECDQF